MPANLAHFIRTGRSDKGPETDDLFTALSTFFNDVLGQLGHTRELLNLDIADGSADADYYIVAPHAGTISKIWTVIDGAVAAADITITASIGGVAVTDGVVTIATAGSAAGDVDSATPSAANSVTAGQAIKFAVAGGGSGGAPRVHLVAEITRS